MKIADHYFNRGNSKILHKDFAGAITLFDKGIEINPKFAKAYYHRGIAKNFNQNLVGNSFDLNKNFEIQFDEGEIFQKNEFNDNEKLINSADSIADFDRAIEINPWFANAYYSRAMVKSGFQNREVVASDILSVKKGHIDDKKYAQKRMNLQETRHEDFSAGIVDFDKAIEIDPEYAEVYHTRGLAKNHQQNLTNSIPDRNNVKINHPDLNRSNHPTLNPLNNPKDFNGAISDFDKAISLNPQFADAYYCRGLAKNYFQDPAVLNVWNPTEPSQIMEAYEKDSISTEFENYDSGKDFDGIIADFDMAIKINPRHDKAYCSRGLIKIFSQNKEKNDLHRIKVIANTDVEAYLTAKSETRLNTMDYSGAIADFDKAIQINPMFANAYYHRGVAKIYCRDRIGAMLDLSRAIEIDPSYGKIYNHGLFSGIFPVPHDERNMN